MRTLWIDFETRSEADIKTVGGEKYCMDASTEAILLAYAWDDEPVRVWELQSLDELPFEVQNPEIFCALTRVWHDVRIVAHNAGFDMCVAKYCLGCDVVPEMWYDSAFAAAYYGYPRALGNLAAYLGTAAKLPQDELRLFSQPVKRKKGADLFGEATVWNDATTHPEEWARFVEYARADVEVMRECCRRMPELPEIERRAMILTMEMNMAGVPFDAEMAWRIAVRAKDYEDTASAIALAKYGISNLRSNPQVQRALKENGVHLPSLNAKERAGVTHEILDLRDQATGAAFRKIPTCFERLCPDQRLRGEFKGHGAHTGRWSSQGAQMQNWPRILRPDTLTLDLEGVESYAHLREHLRLCLCHSPGREFVCADLSQIEARITAYISGCKWLMEAFASGDDVYSRTAEKMFRSPRDPATGKHPKRQEGKACVLGFGFAGGGRAIEKISPALYKELGEAGCNELCQTYRSTHPEIVQMWYTLERCWKEATTRGTSGCVAGGAILKFTFDGHTMRITLPSGRALWYRSVARAEGMYGPEFSYCDWSQGHAVTSKIWRGVLVENIVQAMARDILVDIMWRVRERLAGEIPSAEIVGTVHDEVWMLTRTGTGRAVLSVLLEEMARPIRQYPGLVIKGEGAFGDRYVKA